MGDTLWSDAKVPGTVHQDLLNHNRIPNPFYGMNEEAVQWVENEDWMYRTSLLIRMGLGHTPGYVWNMAPRASGVFRRGKD